MVVPNQIYLAALNGDVDALRAYFASGDRDPNDTLLSLRRGSCFGLTVRLMARTFAARNFLALPMAANHWNFLTAAGVAVTA